MGEGVASLPQATSSASSEIVSAEIENRRFIVDHFLLLVCRRGDILGKRNRNAGVHRGMPHEDLDHIPSLQKGLANECSVPLSYFL